MEVNNFLASVFCSKGCESTATPRNFLEFGNLQEHLEKILAEHNNESKPEYTEQERALSDGRIGPEIVKIDTSGRCGNMDISENLELDSQSNFSSLRANICICRGKWMFEVLLGTRGIMQLGWATVNCQFTNEEGVGDTADSYAYDGHRVRKWNLSASAYGEEWMAGDVIGCTFDLDNGEISYYRNGVNMGVAYTDVPRGAGIAYFPAASLSYCESCQLNFGATPFIFPIEGFKPLQDPPSVELAQAKELLEFLERLLPGPERIPRMPSSLSGRAATLALLTSSHVFEKLAPLLTRSYVVEAALIPFLLNSCSKTVHPTEIHPGVKKMLDLMCACMEDFEIQPCLKHLFYGLLKAYWHRPVLADFKTQTASLSLMLSTLHHEQTRKLWLNMKSFPQKFGYFMHIRPPDDAVLVELFPVVLYEEKDTSTVNSDEERENHKKHCEKLRTKIKVLENIHVEMCKILLEDEREEGCPSTRSAFLEKFRKYLQENMFIALSSHPPSSCSGPVLTCFFHRYMEALRCHWDKWAKENGNELTSQSLFVPVSAFVDKSINYFELSRIGGITSHLRKSHSDKLKNSCPTETKDDMKASGSRGATTSLGSSSGIDISLMEAVDTLIMLYFFGVHRQFSKVRSVRDNLHQNIRALEETDKKINKCPKDKLDVRAELERSRKVFAKETTNCTRQMAWVRSLIFTPEKQADVYWMLNIALKTIENAKKDATMFDFVPEFYIEAICSGYSALRNLFSPTVVFNDLPDCEELLKKMASFFAENVCESSIVNPDLRDTLIQGLVTFSCYPDCLKALEELPSISQERVVRTLMGAYEKRTWVQTTWILIRFWKGCGFAFNYSLQPWGHMSGISDHGLQRVNLQPPCPSPVYQHVLAKLCTEDKALSKGFLNGVLNQLNWAFSEFIGMLQQIQSLPNIAVENRQLKTCIVCFELTVGLLRVLEMVCTVAPQLFTDWENFPSAELNISRLFQLVTQAFNRLTASANIFENVSRLHLPGFDCVDRFPLLSALAGIMLALLKRSKQASIDCACSILFAEPGFQFDSFRFLFDRKSNGGKPVSGFSFSHYKVVSEEELQELEELSSILSTYKEKVNLKRQSSIDSGELCTICYAMPQSAVFVPCGHKSCRACISRHLMNSKICFFCKETVETFEDGSLQEKAKDNNS
ncbi:E3 ubiquitin-protein ligase RNF123-like [Dendronephthya gigantea]|uniref:E3 ubiquitin-protein ligase RNF123-like n=1 Tax=Dendronephthya gigantea TaxID=151771 RepID=UPI00106C6FFD|nr:E3 ubiquitin-protein ligase RNF123-like [Dendronephthya gigantea]